MKKGLFAVLLVVLLVFSTGVPVMARIDLEGEINYELGDKVIDGYTQVAIDIAPEPFDLILTWRRDWLPVQGDSLLLKTGLSLGRLRLGYKKEMLEFDVGIASLTLTIKPFTFGYMRVLDGVDPGTYTLRFETSL